MQENLDAESDYDNATKNNKRASPRAVWTIAAVGVVGVLVIGLIAIVLPNMTERIKFFTTNALSVLLLDVIVVQAYIYSRQWEVMKTQERILERQAKAFEAQVITMQGQLTAISKQADIMNDSLQHTRSLISQNDRAIDAARDMARAAEASVEVAERNVEIAHDHMWHAQRAYLAATDIRIEGSDNKRMFHLKVKNFGNTPASYVDLFLKLELSESLPDSRAYDGDIEWRSLGAIPPSDFVEEVTTIELSEEEQKELARAPGTFREPDLYCWGCIRYKDVFEDGHVSFFSFKQDVRNVARVRPSPTGNEPD